MAGIEGITATKLKKTCIVFGFEDVLVAGSVSGAFDEKPVRQILKNLAGLEKKFGDFHFVLTTGYHREVCDTRIIESGLDRFFDAEKIFCVNPTYVDSKSEVDRELYNQNRGKDPLFKDEFFKQGVIEQVSVRYSIPKEKMVYIGNDLLFSGYYTRRFSGIDVAFVKDSLALRGEAFKGPPISGLTYIRRDWLDIKKLVLEKFPKPDYAPLNLFIQRWLQNEMLNNQALRIVQGERHKTGDLA